MFKYSQDEFISGKQKAFNANFLSKIKESYNIIYSTKIEEIFDKSVSSFELIKELNSIASINNDSIIMPIISRDSANIINAIADLKIGFKKIKKNKKDIIPFIEFSFPDDYKNPEGLSYQHIYIFFCTNFVKYEKAEQMIINYLNRLIKLQPFI